MEPLGVYTRCRVQSDQILHLRAQNDNDRSAQLVLFDISIPEHRIFGGLGVCAEPSARLAPTPALSVARSPLHRFDDSTVRVAPTQVADQRLFDFVFGRIDVGFEQRRRAHHEAGRAVAALPAVFGQERGLERVQVAYDPEAFDRAHCPRADLKRQHRACVHGIAVEQNRARTADSMLTAHVGPRSTDLVA